MTRAPPSIRLAGGMIAGRTGSACDSRAPRRADSDGRSRYRVPWRAVRGLAPHWGQITSVLVNSSAE